MKKKLKLGKLQQLWVDSLRKHPERQESGQLGNGNPSNYTACCLGELLLCKARLEKKKLPFKEGNIWDGDSDTYLQSYETVGLYDSHGYLKGTTLGSYSSLENANDSGVTWPEIADFIETHPEAVFTKSV